MKRRNLILAAGAAALARPALAQTDRARTLVFVPQANLTSLDPIWTTATVTRNYAYLVFDTLYGTDDALQPRPQMAEGHTVEADGKRWTIRLREGLMFHDGTPVRARDCEASLARWMRRDSLGGSIAAVLDAMEAPDDRTLVFRLKRPFPPLLRALAKTQPSPAVIMPERLAMTDPFKQVTEVVGSGPFRFLPDEYVAGSRAVFARFDGYRPREDAPSSVAGRQAGAGGPGRVAHHPRGRHRGERASRGRDRLAGDADPRPDPGVEGRSQRGGRAARPVRALSGAALQPPAGTDHQPRFAPGDFGGDRSARGDAGGDGRRRDHLQRADRLLPAGHPVCERRGDGPGRRPQVEV